MTTCEAQLSAYDHWHCQRRRCHFGRHRYNNYTGARFPRFWRIGKLIKTYQGNRRLRSYVKPGMEAKPRLLPYGKALFPVRFDPVGFQRLADPRE